MSFAESNDVRATEVNRGAGFEFAYSLKLVSATTPSVELTDKDQRLVEYNATGNGAVRLPANPDPWMEFEFVEQVGGAGVLTVDGNGHNINGAPTLTMNVPYQLRAVRFVPALGVTVAQWVIVRAVN